MGWDQTQDMTDAEKADAEIEKWMETAAVHEGTMMVVASTMLNLVKEAQNGRKFEGAFVTDVIKAALMMQHYADECGSLDFFQKHLKPHHTIEDLQHTLPLMRLAAGQKAAQWGDNLMRLLNRVDDARR